MTVARTGADSYPVTYAYDPMSVTGPMIIVDVCSNRSHELELGQSIEHDG